MIRSNPNIKKPIALSAVGITLQMAGMVCLVVGMVGAVKEVKVLLKQKIVEELTKEE